MLPLPCWPIALEKMALTPIISVGYMDFRVTVRDEKRNKPEQDGTGDNRLWEDVRSRCDAESLPRWVAVNLLLFIL